MVQPESEPIKKVCVYCGSASGTVKAFTEAAEELGALFLKKNWGLVYGGGTTGLMGAVARSVASNGGYVHGFIPKALIEREQNNQKPDEAIYGKTTIVGDMHTRKRLMGRKSDAFVAMPGGYGTLEELFEVITWNQLGIHDRPVVILNVNGFYDGLITWINDAVRLGFVSEGNRQIVVEAKTPSQVIEAIENYKVPEGRLNLNWDVQTPGVKDEQKLFFDDKDA